MKEFINGFTSWHETHFEVVAFISTQCNGNFEGKIKKVLENDGTGALYELAEEWTNEFEEKHAGTEWGVDLEYFDTIEEWLKAKNLE